MDTETILDEYRVLKEHLEDARPSHDMAPHGSAMQIIVTTPTSIAETEISSHKRQFLVRIDVLLELVVGTDGLRESLRSSASVMYNFSVSTRVILNLFGNPEEDDWGMFDSAEIQLAEKRTLVEALETTLILGRISGGRKSVIERMQKHLRWIQEFRDRYEAPEEFQGESKSLQGFLARREAL